MHFLISVYCCCIYYEVLTTHIIIFSMKLYTINSLPKSTVNDLINPHLQINAPYLINTLSALLTFY